MKSRPIPFSGPMVRAIIDGRKTMTRRVVALPRKRGAFVLEDHGDGWWPYQSDDGESSVCNDGCEHPYSCPYGVPGDQLWVRETFMDLGACFLYRADANAEQERAIVAPGQRWKPAIHMPRAASRINLEITDVRVERLQEISEADAEAEGVANSLHLQGGRFANENFAHLWDMINGDGSWDANPWVWVVEFRRVT